MRPDIAEQQHIDTDPLGRSPQQIEQSFRPVGCALRLFRDVEGHPDGSRDPASAMLHPSLADEGQRTHLVSILEHATQQLLAGAEIAQQSVQNAVIAGRNGTGRGSKILTAFAAAGWFGEVEGNQWPAVERSGTQQLLGGGGILAGLEGEQLLGRGAAGGCRQAELFRGLFWGETGRLARPGEDARVDVFDLSHLAPLSSLLRASYPYCCCTGILSERAG